MNLLAAIRNRFIEPPKFSAMTLQEKLIFRYGNPLESQREFEKKWMVLWDIPLNINTHIPALPNQLYVNRDAVTVFQKWFEELINHGLYKEIKTFDGCFNPRYQRGSKTKISIHAFGLALDFNASQNPLGLTYDQCLKKGLVPFSENFLRVAENCFLTAGGNFKVRPDRMHFESLVHIK